MELGDLGDISRSASEKIKTLRQQDRLPEKEADEVVETFYDDLRAKLGIGRPQDLDDPHIAGVFTVGKRNFISTIDEVTGEPSDQKIVLIIKGPEGRTKVRILRPKQKKGSTFTINDDPKSENTRNSAKKLETIRKKMNPSPNLSARKALIEEEIKKRVKKRARALK